MPATTGEALRQGQRLLRVGFFATDRTFLNDHRGLLEESVALVDKRKQPHLQRTGRKMTGDNIWLQEQNRTIDALRLIIAALEAHSDDELVCLKGSGSPRRPVPHSLTLDISGSAARRFHASR